MTKKELIEMLVNVPDDANIKISVVNESLFSRRIKYADVNGFYKLTDIDYVLAEY